MEGDRHADESYGFDDGLATLVNHCLAQDDERPGNEKRDGTNAATNECQQSGNRLVLIANSQQFVKATISK